MAGLQRRQLFAQRAVPLAAGISLALLASPAPAQPVATGGVTIEKWAADLAAPQGLATDGHGNVFVVENRGGRVLRFSRDGKERAVFAEGLRAPSWALFMGGVLYVAEREGNSVARITSDGSVTRLEGEVTDPVGLATDPRRPGSLLVVLHRASIVRQFAPAAGSGQLVLQPGSVAGNAEEAAYGWRDLAVAADGTLYVTHEIQRAVLRRRPGGELQAWVSELSSPSGLALSPRGELYLTEEGNGRLSHITSEGRVEVLAEGLGRAREALFLDERTLLVSDRGDGVVWKVVLPPVSR